MANEFPFVVEGVELDDGSRVVLHESDSSCEAIEWMRKYSARDSGWHLIEVYDLRSEPAERIASWNDETDE